MGSSGVSNMPVQKKLASARSFLSPVVPVVPVAPDVQTRRNTTHFKYDVSGTVISAG